MRTATSKGTITAALASLLFLLLAGPLRAQRNSTVAPQPPEATLVISGRVTAAPATNTLPSHEVQSLIEQLDDPSVAKRDSAADALAQMGPSISPQLHAALDQKHIADAFTRLRKIVTEIDDGVEIAASTTPSVITLHAADAPLHKVLQDFATQADTDIVVYGTDAIEKVNTATITVDLDHGSFWDALHAIVKAVPIPASVQGNQLDLGDMRTNLPLAEAAAAFTGDSMGSSFGPLLVWPQQAIVNESITYGTPRQPGNIQLRLDVLCEPRITLAGQLNATAWNITDDRGHALPTSNSGFSSYNSSAVQFFICSVLTREVPGIGGHLKSVKGVLHVAEQTKSKSIDIKDLANAAGQSRDLDGATLKINTVMNNPSQFRLQITLSGLPSTAANVLSNQNNPFANARFLDDSLMPVSPQSNGTSHSTNGGTSTWIWSPIFLSNTGIPTSLHMEITTETTQVDIPIDLHDVEIPVLPGG